MIDIHRSHNGVMRRVARVEQDMVCDTLRSELAKVGPGVSFMISFEDDYPSEFPEPVFGYEQAANGEF